MPYSAKSIANAFINKAFLEGKPIGPLKLQKLMYYASGYYLAAFDEPLIDQLFEAWDYGPVVPSVYREFREFGNRSITRLATEFAWDADDELFAPIPSDDARVSKVVDFVWRHYGGYSSWQLSDMTHQEGTPWREARKSNPYRLRNKDIDNELIKNYFTKLIKK